MKRWYLDDEKNASIYRFEENIYDKDYDKKIASLIFYNLYPSMNHPLAYGTSIPCDQEKYFTKERSVNEVIMPKKYQPK